MQVSAQGLEQRFTPNAVTFMKGLLEAGLEEMVSSEAGRTLLPQFNGVYVTDCTRLVWGKDGVKLGVRWELQQGQLQASLSDLTTHDQKTAVVEHVLPAGSLHLGDLGFYKLKRFATWSEQGVYWLSRFRVGTTVFHPDGQRLDLLAHLDKASGSVVLPLHVGSEERLSAFLVAERIPDDAYAKRLARLQEQARLDQRLLSPRQAVFARWTLYLTNIPDLTFPQAHLLARTRWQIELLFKLWKSHGKVLVSRSADPIRQQCEAFAKLLGVLVAHWLLLVSAGQHDRLGALDALRIVRAYVPLLIRAFTHPFLWDFLFAWLRDAFLTAPPLSKRRNHPLAFQLWQDFDLVLP